MKICSICHKISGNDNDHVDCVERRRIELEDEDFKSKIPERLDVSGGSELASEIKAVIEHMTKKEDERA